MPGCVIQCSNVYADASGKEVVSPVEYETLGLLGTNCGLSDPDDLAQMNFLANDLGVDTIELGATLAVLMEAGLGVFGDVKFMADCMAEMRRGSAQGRLWAQGTARVGAHYKVRRGHGTSLTKDFFEPLGQAALRMEYEFNRRAGFTEKDDELPEFFYSEPLPPTNHVARFHGPDVHGMYERLPA